MGIHRLKTTVVLISGILFICSTVSVTGASVEQKLNSSFGIQNDFFEQVSTTFRKSFKMVKSLSAKSRSNHLKITTAKVMTRTSRLSVKGNLAEIPRMSKFGLYPQTGASLCRNLVNACLNLMSELQAMYTYLLDLMKTLGEMKEELKSMKAQAPLKGEYSTQTKYMKAVKVYEKTVTAWKMKIFQIEAAINKIHGRINQIRLKLKASQAQLSQCGIKKDDLVYLKREQDEIINRSNTREIRRQ